MDPVVPLNNPDQVVGFLGSLVVWDELLANVFSEVVSGIDCVLETSDNTTFFYQVNGGKATPMYVVPLFASFWVAFF